MKIYISGPITGTDDYMERFEAAEKMLTEAGLSVVNPAKVSAQLPKDTTTYSEYMEMSITMLGMCEAIYMLENWTESKGAVVEFEYAYKNRKSILFEGVNVAWLTSKHENVSSTENPASE